MLRVTGTVFGKFSQNLLAMLLNYLKLAIRLLIRNPLISLINIAGLSVGFAAFFVLWLYAQNELKTDRFYTDWERIVRCGLHTQWTDDKTNWEEATVAGNRNSLAIQLSDAYNEVEDVTILTFPNFFRKPEVQAAGHGGDVVLSFEKADGNRISFLESKLVYADPNVFTFFSIPAIAGEPEKMLTTPGSVALSKKSAEKYFGKEDPVGKVLSLNDSIHLLVTGVFENLPANSHLDFEVAISSATIAKAISDNKITLGHCYFRLAKNANEELLEKRINSELEETITKAVWRNWPYGKAQIYLQPVSDIAFDHFRVDLHTPKSRRVLTMYGIFSWIVLFMAWINYINLTVSLSGTRAKELIARKTSGAGGKDFILQFLTEAVLIHLFAISFAFTIVQLTKVPLWTFLHLYIQEWTDIPSSSIFLMIFLLMCSILLTTLYPALITLKQSARNLFSFFKGGKNENHINYIITTCQFALAVTLIISIFSFYKQNRFILGKNIGLNTEQVLIVDCPVNKTTDFLTKLTDFQEQVLQLHGVSGTTSSFSVAGNAFVNTIYLERANFALAVESDGGVDANFIPFFRIKLLAGRNFSSDAPANQHSIIVSKGATERLGFDKPEQAVGSKIKTYQQRELEIIGVIEDYSLRPLLRRIYEDEGYSGLPGSALTYLNSMDKAVTPQKISFRVDGGHIQEILPGIQTKYRSAFPGSIFNYSFLNDVMREQYTQYIVALRQVAALTLLAIGLACLGLLGVMTHKCVQKTKEIGIRKVLGAALHQIAYLLLNTTIKQIMISIMIGIPLAFYLTNRYLEEFSEKVVLRWWHYSVPVGVLLVILSCTVASMLWRTARSNPVEALKYE